ncbi:hypothetical protein HPB47_004402, partial [Ixodes persulcatus]
EGDKVFFLRDPPPLLMSTRNNLKKFDFLHGDMVYTWDNIKAFYEKDRNMILRIAGKLKNIRL